MVWHVLKLFSRKHASENSTIGPLLLPDTYSLLLPSSTARDTIKHKSAKKKAVDIAQQALPVVSGFSGVIPLAGPYLKASIDTLLVLLNNIKARDRNTEVVTPLIQRLYQLGALITSVPTLASPIVQQQRDELARKFFEISERLKEMDSRSILGSADIAQAIIDCYREIDEAMMGYMFISTMQIKNSVQIIAEQLPRSVHQEMVYVKDATGREFKLLADQCQSLQQFIDVLQSYFINDTPRDILLRDFIGRDAYELSIEGNSGTTTTLKKWYGTVQPGTRIIMSALFDQHGYDSEHQCPRPQCKMWNFGGRENDSWIRCAGCPGRFHVTNAEKRTNKKTNLDSNTMGSTNSETKEIDTIHLNLIEIFRIRKEVYPF